MVATPELHHATTIAIAGRAAMIRGRSGAGKSDLALRGLAVPAGFANADAARLVADDQTCVRLVDGRVMVNAPERLHGLIEVRGLGILRFPAAEGAELVLVVDLVEPGKAERFPETLEPAVIAGKAIPRLLLAPFEASAPLKLLLALGATSASLDR